MDVTSVGRGHGSTFFFELPVYGPDYSPPQPSPPPTQSLLPGLQQQQLTNPKPSVRVARNGLLPPSIAIEGESEDRSYAYTAVPANNGFLPPEPESTKLEGSFPCEDRLVIDVIAPSIVQAVARLKWALSRTSPRFAF